MTRLSLQMAKASPADIEAVQWLATAFDLLDDGCDTKDPEGNAAFDADNAEDCRRVIAHIREKVSRGALFRVAWGMAVVCDARNELLDPDSDVIAPHPKAVAARSPADEGGS